MAMENRKKSYGDKKRVGNVDSVYSSSSRSSKCSRNSTRSSRSSRNRKKRKSKKQKQGLYQWGYIGVVLVLLVLLLAERLLRGPENLYGFMKTNIEESVLERITSGDKLWGEGAKPLTRKQRTELLTGVGFSLQIILLIFYIRMMFKLFLGADNANYVLYDGKDKVTFQDIAGQDEAKKELIEVVDFLKNPKKYEVLGAKVPRGVLLEGPPGTGKTLLARACANEANVPFLSISGSSFVEKFVGTGAARVRSFFQKAREISPSICFIDEIDSVGMKRGQVYSHSEREQTINQLLSEMDGFSQTSVIVMAATNRADTLDSALLRPGRFDRHVTVGLPDAKGRKEILKLHTRTKPLAKDVDLDSIAKIAIGFSGADLAHICNEAALKAAVDNCHEINHSYFTLAFERKVLGMKRPPLADYEDRKLTAYHEAGHALVAILTPGADAVFKVTITPRGQSLGVTAFTPTEGSNYSRKRLLARICVALGGRAAEELLFDDVTVGAADDLRTVTDLAMKIVTQFGMGKSIGQMNYEDNKKKGYGMSEKLYSEETARKIDMETQELVNKMYKRTKKLLEENLDKLHRLAQALLEKEILEKNDIRDLLQLE